MDLMKNSFQQRRKKIMPHKGYYAILSTGKTI